MRRMQLTHSANTQALVLESSPPMTTRPCRFSRLQCASESANCCAVWILSRPDPMMWKPPMLRNLATTAAVSSTTSPVKMPRGPPRKPRRAPRPSVDCLMKSNLVMVIMTIIIVVVVGVVVVIVVVVIVIITIVMCRKEGRKEE